MKLLAKIMCLGLIASSGAFANWVPPKSQTCGNGVGSFTVKSFQYIQYRSGIENGLGVGAGYIEIRTVEYGDGVPFRYAIDGNSLASITHAQTVISMLQTARTSNLKIMMYATGNSCNNPYDSQWGKDPTTDITIVALN